MKAHGPVGCVLGALLVLGAACSSSAPTSSTQGDAGIESCGTETCGDTCSDPNNCGGCGNICVQGAMCNDGVCACSAGETVCNGQCVDEQSNPEGCRAAPGNDGGSIGDASPDVTTFDGVAPTDGPAGTKEAAAPCTPTGSFVCGNTTCTLPTQYCQEDVSDAGTGYSCLPTPQNICGCSPTCGCGEFTSLCTNNNLTCSMSGNAVTLVCHVQGV